MAILSVPLGLTNGWTSRVLELTHRLLGIQWLPASEAPFQLIVIPRFHRVDPRG